MELVLNFICLHADYAHFIFFGLILLAGLNIPISEDLMLLTGGAIASTCIPNQTLHLYGWIFAACWISAWEAYWIGRLLGPKLYNIFWFNRIITPKRIKILHDYYEKFGILVFIVGRFCPGGVRNALFMTSGLGKMPFITFLMRDGLACLLSTSTIFYIGFKFGENYKTIFYYFRAYEKFVISLFISILAIVMIYVFLRKKKSTS